MEWLNITTFASMRSKRSQFFSKHMFPGATDAERMQNAKDAARAYWLDRYRALYTPTACGWGPVREHKGRVYHGAHGNHCFYVEPGPWSGQSTTCSFKQWDNYTQTFEAAQDYCNDCELVEDGPSALSGQRPCPCVEGSLPKVAVLSS